jgi:hypothetical protein
VKVPGSGLIEQDESTLIVDVSACDLLSCHVWEYVALTEMVCSACRKKNPSLKVLENPTLPPS